MIFLSGVKDRGTQTILFMETKKMLATLLIAGCAQGAFAQDRVLTGRVIDAETGRPVSGANIRVAESLTGCTTNNDGYFTLSIPYDKGFKIKVDGQKVDYEMVNTSFIGFPISEGEHHIEIEYEAPFKKIGMSLSIFGFICYFIIIYKQKKKII